MRRYFDSFMLHDELDMLELRLYELQDVPGLTHIIVEADVTHQDGPKPSYFLDNRDRFSPWKDRIVHVWATGLPTAAEAPNPWARELAQREWAAAGIARFDPQPADIVLHGDVDEVPRPLNVVNVPAWVGITAFGQTGHFWAVDWLYPHIWWGTVAATVRTMGRLGSSPFQALRNRRNIPADPLATLPDGWAAGWPMPGRSTVMRDAGWHLSWLGDAGQVRHKLESFCHPEVADRLDGAIRDGNRYHREGRHVDGLALAPVDVDDTWPRYIVERKCPDTWWRPR